MCTVCSSTCICIYVHSRYVCNMYNDNHNLKTCMPKRSNLSAHENFAAYHGPTRRGR